MLSPGMVKKLILSLAFGVAVFVALGAVTDLGKTAEAISHFGWQYLPVALALTLLNYLLRFVKWHYFLGLIGAQTIGLKRSALIFFSAFSMVMTPGKVGELLKSYLLRETNGTAISASAPIILAERLSDGLAMVLLASVGLILYGYAWQVLVLAVGPAAIVVAVSQHRPFARTLLDVAERLPIIAARVHHLRAFYESSNRLFRLPNLALAVGIGVVSWAGESIAFYLILMGLGFNPSPTLLVQATFVLAVSTLVGAVALTPGGLGAADGSIAGLLLFLGMTTQPSVAGAATVLIRFCTLWFGVGLGLVVFVVMTRSIGAKAIAGSPAGET